MGAQSSIMALTGSVIGAANVASKLYEKFGGEDEQMASKARMTRDNKIKTRKMNMKASRVKMGGKK